MPSYLPPSLPKQKRRRRDTCICQVSTGSIVYFRSTQIFLSNNFLINLLNCYMLQKVLRIKNMITSCSSMRDAKSFEVPKDVLSIPPRTLKNRNVYQNLIKVLLKEVIKIEQSIIKKEDIHY